MGEPTKFQEKPNGNAEKPWIWIKKPSVYYKLANWIEIKKRERETVCVQLCS